MMCRPQSLLESSQSTQRTHGWWYPNLQLDPRDNTSHAHNLSMFLFTTLCPAAFYMPTSRPSQRWRRGSLLSCHLVSCIPSCPPRLSAPQGLQTPSPFHSCTIYWLILLFLWPPDYHTWSWWVEFIDTITARFSSLHCPEACLHLSPNPSYHFWPSSHYFIFFPY